MVTIIHGTKNQGKTTIIKQIISDLLKQQQKISGFYSEKITQNHQVIGYHIVSIPKHTIFPFLSIYGNKTQQKIGPFYINKTGLKQGLLLLEQAKNSSVEVIIIDEVGQLELQDNGWARGIELLLPQFKGNLILSVRTKFVNAIIAKWHLKNVTLVSI